jgi:hypothetical protein
MTDHETWTVGRLAALFAEFLRTAQTSELLALYEVLGEPNETKRKIIAALAKREEFQHSDPVWRKLYGVNTDELARVLKASENTVGRAIKEGKQR